MDDVRQRVFAAMRDARAQALKRLERARYFAPRAGEIEVGGGYFDASVGPEMWCHYLFRLGKGDTPDAAKEATMAEARLWVANHNARRPKDVAWQRYEGTADSTIELVHALIVAAVR